VDSLAASKLLGKRIKVDHVWRNLAILPGAPGVELAGGGETGAKGERGTLGPHGVTAVRRWWRVSFGVESSALAEMQCR
jgi:hypothetical protein